MTDDRKPAPLAAFYANEARVALERARATKCACGVERRFCNDHRETESEAS
jgi:hypothetical protein